MEVKLYFSPDRYPKAKEVCQVIADQLAKVGIKDGTGVSRVCYFLGQGRGQRRKAAVFTTSAGRPQMPIRFTINIIVPA